tara:strand:- start:579 stop:923 length:345 start_codon:yes stop_codon:yes gene_type:complete
LEEGFDSGVGKLNPPDARISVEYYRKQIRSSRFRPHQGFGGFRPDNFSASGLYSFGEISATPTIGFNCNFNHGHLLRSFGRKAKSRSSPLLGELYRLVAAAIRDGECLEELKLG